MIIKKFQAPTETEAILKAREGMGNHAVVVNIRTIKPRGIMALFKKSTVEVTAALEEKDALKEKDGLKEKDAQAVSVSDYLSGKEPNHSKITFEAVSKPEETMEKDLIQAIDKIRIREEQKQENAAKAAKAREEKKDDNPFSIPDKRNKERETDKREEQRLEEKLESLQALLEENLEKGRNSGKSGKKQKQEEKNSEESEIEIYSKMIYNKLLEHEVDEQYANMIVNEIDRYVNVDNCLDYVLSSVYQKMILKLGEPKPIQLTKKRPKVVFFIGPTGVGKTTTIAKIASKFALEDKIQVAMLTADTYRIAATEQLNTYANILNIPFKVVYTPEEIQSALEEFSAYDLILVDTAGHSHQNEKQLDDTKKITCSIEDGDSKEIFLVLSATTKYKDLLRIVDSYKEIPGFKLIFTKLDETTYYGNILNVKLYTEADLSYLTCGQNVPDDIEKLDAQKIVKQLLGGD